MQNFIHLALKLREAFSARRGQDLTLTDNDDILGNGHIANKPSLENPPYLAPRQYFKNLPDNFFGINMRTLCAKFQP